MPKIHYVEINDSNLESSLIFDMDKLELIERRNNVVHIFVHDKHSILECETSERAQLICVNLYDAWKYWDRQK